MDEPASLSPVVLVLASGRGERFLASGGSGSYSWSAPDGSPSSDTGSSFATRFYNYSGWTRDSYVTVTDTGWYYPGQTATCRVRVSSETNPTPTPSPYGWFGFDHSVRNQIGRAHV